MCKSLSLDTAFVSVIAVRLKSKYGETVRLGTKGQGQSPQGEARSPLAENTASIEWKHQHNEAHEP